MHDKVKRHLISAAVTFIAAFSFVLLGFLANIEKLEDLSAWGVVLSAATLAGIRAFAKWALEVFFVLPR